jgi:hypothetical protein
MCCYDYSGMLRSIRANAPTTSGRHEFVEDLINEFI